MTTLTVEIAVTINATGSPNLDSVTSCTPTDDGTATLDQTTSPPTVTVNDYDCDTVVVNLNPPTGETLDETQVSSEITPTSAPISYSWSSAGNPLTLTVTGLTQIGSELEEDVNLSIASSTGDPIFIINRGRKP